MKRTIVILSIILFIFILSACTKDREEPTSAGSQNKDSEEQTTITYLNNHYEIPLKPENSLFKCL